MIELIFHLNSTWWSFLPSLRLIVFSSRHMMEQVSTRSLFGRAVGKLWESCEIPCDDWQSFWNCVLWFGPEIRIWWVLIFVIDCHQSLQYDTQHGWFERYSVLKKKNVWGRWFNFSIYNNWCSKYCSPYTWTLWAAFSSALIVLKQSCDLYLSSNSRCLPEWNVILMVTAKSFLTEKTQK